MSENLELLKPSTYNEKGKCNVFEGRWVYKPRENPLYGASKCPFLSDQVSCRRNGRPDFEYEKWSWEANDCRIPSFDAIDTLESLRGKRVILVGDSLNRNQWESLVCLLYSVIPSSRAHVDFREGSYKVFKAKDYNVSVEFYWSPFLVQLHSNEDTATRVLRVDKLEGSSRHWQGANVMVFNTGHWWVHRGKFKA
ncbi:Protein trichome birefringence-like 3 [Forsythia ovata]|uniref:Protein trichome birefringence-like 3 n=1 Tax=Forsythia ovata TaxID=205694 RepID=A0ABD1S7X0_9LAMI